MAFRTFKKIVRKNFEVLQKKNEPIQWVTQN
jgi:hypothetical protein